MFLAVQFKFFRERSLNCCLNLFNLISVERQVIQYLPLFRSSLVKVYFLGFDLLSANNIFNPVLKLNLYFSRSGVVIEIGKASISPLQVNYVVFVLIVTEVG